MSLYNSAPLYSSDITELAVQAVLSWTVMFPTVLDLQILYKSLFLWRGKQLRRSSVKLQLAINSTLFYTILANWVYLFTVWKEQLHPQNNEFPNPKFLNFLSHGNFLVKNYHWNHDSIDVCRKSILNVFLSETNFAKRNQTQGWFVI